MKMRYVIAGLSILLVGYASGASAVEPSAVLQQPKGQVFVSQAKGMAPAQHGMPLYAGNRVMVSAGGGAMVVYADGCTVSLSESSLLAIGGPKQCKAGQAVAHAVGGFKDAQIGQAPPAAPWIPFAAVAGGVALAAGIAASDDDNETPVTPEPPASRR